MHCKPPASSSSIGQNTITGGQTGNIGLNVVTGGSGAGTGNLAGGTVAQFNMVSDNLPFNNMLVNPAFNFAQLQTPGTLTTIADNITGPDGWKVNRDTTDVQYQRNTNIGAGLTASSAFRGTFKKITNPGKFMVYQALESRVSQNLQNVSLSFTVRLNLSAAHKMRIGIMNWTAGIDAVVPQPIAGGNWGASGVFPTLNANFNSIVSLQLNGGSTIVGASVWNVASTFGNIASGTTTFLVYVLADDSFAVNDTLDIYETSLDIGAGGRFTFKGLDPSEDVLRCERRYEKSYDIDVPTGTVSNNGAIDFTQVVANHIEPIRFRAKKIFTAPTVVLLSAVTGAAANFADITAAADNAVTQQSKGQSGVSLVVTGGTANHFMRGHYTADSQL